MIAAFVPDEARRLQALEDYQILDTPAEPCFDEVVQLAAQICAAPVAMISFVASDRQWFKSVRGVDVRETPRDISFCQHTLGQPEQVLIVPDATQDERFRDSPLVTGNTGFRFYAGAPLVAPDRSVLGTLCVVDRVPRTMTAEQEFGLRTLAAQIMAQLNLRRLAAGQQVMLDRVRDLERIIDNSPVIVLRWHTSPVWCADYVSSNITALFGYEPEALISGNITCFDLIHPADVSRCMHERMSLTFDSSPPGSSVRREYRILTQTGAIRWVRDVTWCVEKHANGHGTFEAVLTDVTSEYAIVAAHRARDERFAALCKSSRSGIFECDREGRTIFQNQQLLEIFGTRLPQEVGDNWIAYVHPADRARIRDAWTATMQTGKDYTVDYRIMRPDHSLRWVSARARALRDAAGLISGYVGAIADVTDYHVAAEALRRSETQYRQLVDTLKDVVFQTDPAGNWTFLNAAWHELTGASVDESLGKPFLAWVHPDDRPARQTALGPLLERQIESCRHETRYVARDGRIRWVEVFARATVDAHGQVTGTTGTLTDVTERKQAEETRRRQLAAIEAAIDGVAIVDGAERFVYMNATHAEMFGYAAPADLMAGSWRNFYSPEQVDCFDNDVLPRLAIEKKWRGEVTARRADGSTFPQELSLTVIEGGGRVCVCRDLTERHQAQERIQASLREKDVMLKEIHHRVKNNMQIVSSLLNLQLAELTDPAVRELFVEAQNRIASMALVHEKLYQSHDLASINVADYIRDLAGNLVSSHGTRSRDVTLRLDIGDVVLGIDTAIPCGLIITELVTNAYKHGFPQGGSGEVMLRLHRSAPKHLRLEVSDSGAGLPAAYDPRASRSLGMKLVQLLVQQLRGSLRIERETGTCFVIELREVKPRGAPPNITQPPLRGIR